MSVKRKQPSAITLELKMKVLQDYDGIKTKVELAKLHGISATSVTRIISNRENLESLIGIVTDPDQQQRILRLNTVTKEKKKPNNVKRKSKKAMTTTETKDDQTMADTNLKDKLPVENPSEDDEDPPQSPDPAREFNFEDPEASFEKALNQLKQYTVQLFSSPFDNGNSVDLYELYEELMESEFCMRNIVC